MKSVLLLYDIIQPRTNTLLVFDLHTTLGNKNMKTERCRNFTLSDAEWKRQRTRGKATERQWRVEEVRQQFLSLLKQQSRTANQFTSTKLRQTQAPCVATYSSGEKLKTRQSLVQTNACSLIESQEHFVNVRFKIHVIQTLV